MIFWTGFSVAGSQSALPHVGRGVAGVARRGKDDHSATGSLYVHDAVLQA